MKFCQVKTATLIGQFTARIRWNAKETFFLHCNSNSYLSDAYFSVAVLHLLTVVILK